jgi:hypothetical protein
VNRLNDSPGGMEQIQTQPILIYRPEAVVLEEFDARLWIERRAETVTLCFEGHQVRVRNGMGGESLCQTLAALRRGRPVDLFLSAPARILHPESISKRKKKVQHCRLRRAIVAAALAYAKGEKI